MYKELIITSIIVIVIVIGNIFTNKKLENSTQSMKEGLNNLEKAVLDDDKNNIEISMRNINILWDSLYQKLSFYIEHDELEKVAVRLSSMEGNRKVDEYEQMMQYIEECKFILDHIQDKESLHWENIF